MIRILQGCLLVLLLLGAGPAAASTAPGPPEPIRQEVAGTTPNSPSEALVIEVLRLQVPAQHRQAWLEAERASWQPWLEAQDGFLSRQLFWDPQRQEGHLLIRWASRDQWKAIPPEAVDQVQTRFEQLARRLTGSQEAHPFPLVFEAELQPL